jgi:salicylate biosynthesis isochorismate synthase
MATIVTIPAPHGGALQAAATCAASGRAAWVAIHGHVAAGPILGLPAPKGQAHAAWVGPDGVSWRAIGAARVWEATDAQTAMGLPDACRAGLEAVFGAPAARAMLRGFGGLAFDPASPETPWGDAGPVGRFVLPRWLVKQAPDGAAEAIALVDAAPGEPEGTLAERAQEAFQALAAWVQGPAEAACWPVARAVADPGAQLAFESAVSAAIRAIEAGGLTKVVLARSLRLEADAPLPPGPLFAALAAAAPGTFRFLIADGEDAFLGASPELLFRLRGEVLAADALAGTAGRGADPEADEALASALAADAKERHEHAVVVGAIADALAPIARSLEVPETPGLRRLPTVQHLHTPIRAVLAEGTSIGAVLGAMHPTPAVGGAPRERAMGLIRQLEAGGRGWYAGPVGWVGLDEAEFAVAIRSAYVREHRAAVMAGAGIVAGSKPASEWAETARKAAPLVRLLTGEVAR